jgi:hypothetical protein
VRVTPTTGMHWRLTSFDGLRPRKLGRSRIPVELEGCFYSVYTAEVRGEVKLGEAEQSGAKSRGESKNSRTLELQPQLTTTSLPPLSSRLSNQLSVLLLGLPFLVAWSASTAARLVLNQPERTVPLDSAEL